jgi:hypothetical protein
MRYSPPPRNSMRDAFGWPDFGVYAQESTMAAVDLEERALGQSRSKCER